MHKFKISTSRIEFEVELKDKYVFISGDSCKGKSKFIQEVERVMVTAEGSIQATLPYYLVRSKDDLENMSKHVKEDGVALFISDEFVAARVVENIQGLNAYCIVITRNVYKHINYSYRCLYELERNEDGVSYIKPSIELKTIIPTEGIMQIITEDKKAGYEFIKSVASDNIEVVSAGGKTNIQKCIKAVKEIKTLLVVCDGGGIGSDIKLIKRQVYEYVSRGGCVVFCFPECFEHILLCSSFLGYDKDIFKYFRLESNNTESFCEEEILRVTKGKPFEFNHKSQKLTDCWIKNCSSCVEACEYHVDGDKLQAVLQKGPCSNLLSLR